MLIILYARYYLSNKDPVGQFYTYLLLFQGAMVGIVLSDNILLLLIFWELTSLSSFLLIGYWKHLPAGRQGARMALTVTGMGGLSMIAGMLLLGNIAGSYDISEILKHKDAIQASPMYLPALLLILGGAFTKSAQFPFHFWLPPRDGRAHAGLGLSAFGDDGEGGAVPDGADVAGSVRHARVVLHRRGRRADHHADRRKDRDFQT